MNSRSITLTLALLVTALCDTSMAAEMRLALSAKVNFSPNAVVVYSEDTVNFYGTHIYLLEDNLLRGRAEEQLGHPAPPDLKVTAERIPNTSIILVRASSADDKAAAAFLSALVDQFLKFKTEQRKSAFSEEIARITAALKSAPPEALPEIEKARKQLVASSFLDTAPMFVKIPEK